MTWTFTNDPSNARDLVRLYIGDFDPSREIISDEIILGELEKSGNDAERAAICVLEYMIALYITMSGRVRIGRFEYDAMRMVESLQQRRKWLVQKVTGVPLAWAGGLSIWDRCESATAYDHIPPRFIRDQHKNWS